MKKRLHSAAEVHAGRLPARERSATKIGGSALKPEVARLGRSARGATPRIVRATGVIDQKKGPDWTGPNSLNNTRGGTPRD